VAQPAPLRPDLRAGTAYSKVSSNVGPLHLVLREDGWATDIRWPVKERLEARRVDASARTLKAA